MRINLRIVSVLLLICALDLFGFADGVITGRVINQSVKRPSAGDHVILLRLGRGMETESETTTDGRGDFSLPVSVPDAAHLLRVVHEGVNYDQRLNGDQSVQVQVFDAVPRVSGLSATVGMAQIEADGAMLKVTEMYDLLNTSQPPVTQVKARNFEFSIPRDATLDSFQAKRAGGVWVNLSATPIPGSTGRYGVGFPLRPGDTLFRFTYRVPYTGAVTFKFQPAYPVKNFAVAHPPAMTFKPERAADFTSPGIAKGLRFEQAVSRAALREIPAFEISSIGAAAPSVAVADSSSSASPNASLSQATSVVLPANAAAQMNDSRMRIWPLLIALTCLFATSLFGLLRRRRQAESAEGNNHVL